jgi:hypothetical protein
MAAAIFGMCTAGLSTNALASPIPPAPPKDQVATCKLTTSVVNGIKSNLKFSSGITTSNVDFVLVYSLANANDGQPTTGGYTGPVLCVNPASVTYPPPATNENTPIGPEGQAWNITDLEQALLLQYQKTSGVREKRVCHTVAGNTNCFLITPVSPP